MPSKRKKTAQTLDDSKGNPLPAVYDSLLQDLKDRIGPHPHGPVARYSVRESGTGPTLLECRSRHIDSARVMRDGARRSLIACRTI